MNNDNILAINVPNIISVGVMAAVFFVVIGVGLKLWQARSGGSAPAAS